MKRLSRCTGALLIIFGIFMFTAIESQAGNTEKVTGEVGFWNDSAWARSYFDAHEGYDNRPAKGSFYYEDNSVEPMRYYKFPVTCTEVNGTHATFSGCIDETNDFSLVGKWVQIWVYDGGTPGREGDSIMSIFYDDDPACNGTKPTVMIPIADGNLVVHYSYSNTISGVVAAGAPVVGIVNIKGANGATASSPIQADGSYNIDVTSLTVPYILYAEGSIHGNGITMYSAGVGPEINITPVTDFILRNALAGQAETAWNSWDATQVDPTALENAETKVQEQLAPLLNAVGVPADVDLITSPFNADHTGMDMVLEALDINYDGNVATVTNKFTDSSYTDDITNPTDGDGLPASDEADTQLVLTDHDAIKQFWQVLENLYATSSPSSAELTNWFNTYVADDFVNDGNSKTDELDEWIDEEGPSVGMTLSSIIVSATDVTDTIYTKGYQIRVYYTDQWESGSFLTFMVYDGMNWLWYGDQMWVDISFRSHAQMQVDINDNITFYTGLAITLWDDTNYAYNQGARSAIIIGPGLPVEGQILVHYYPEPFFRLYPPDVWGHPSGGWGLWLDDSEISTIPDNAKYTINLYVEAPEVVSLNNTPIWSYTKTLPKSPVLNSELDSSLFPTLITPSSHDESMLTIPGIVNVSWINPSNMKVDYINLGLHSPDWSTGYLVSTEVTLGDTSAALDTTDLPSDVLANHLYLHGEDTYERRFGLGWDMFSQP